MSSKDMFYVVLYNRYYLGWSFAKCYGLSSG